jgi:hypothetical protein
MRMNYIFTKAFYWSSLLLILFVISCDSEDGLNCTQAAGDFIEQEFELEPFDKILVFERLKLTVKDGPIQKVVVKTGENLLNDIDVIVNDGRLEVVNNNGCNLVRDYGITEVVVTSPNINEIRSSTGEDVRSEGVLSWNSLTLLSNDGPEEDFYHSTGNFRLQLAVQNLTINTNKLSNFYLSGTVENADLNWDEGDGRLIANDLIIQNAQIFHRGTATWNMDVRENISGIINGYGDVILKSRPTTVNVQETWQGRLIIDN